MSTFSVLLSNAVAVQMDSARQQKRRQMNKTAIVFPLYNKAFKLLADSNIPLFCLCAAGGRGEERVIDGPADTLFKAKAEAEKAAV